MIKCKDGNVELKGKGYQLLTDLTLIVKALREEGCTEELLQKAFFLSGLSEEETNNEAMGEILEFIKKMGKEKE